MLCLDKAYVEDLIFVLSIYSKIFLLLLFDFYVFCSLASSPSVVSQIKYIYTSPSICQGGIEHRH